MTRWLGHTPRSNQYLRAALTARTYTICNQTLQSTTVHARVLKRFTTTNPYNPWLESASELYRPNDRRLTAMLVASFAYRLCHVVSVTDPYGRILGFLDRSRYLFFQVAPQLYSRGWVGPVPDPLLLRKSSSAGNWTRSSGSVTRNSDH
jgi:hypothetical protein